MTWVLYLCLIVIFAVCVIMSLASGLWGNLLMIFNVILAGLIATSYFEPLARWLENQMPTYTYLWDFVAIWVVFSLAAGLLRALTDTMSRVKVRFKKPVELAGGLLCGAIIGWLMICFTLFSLHTAPLAEQFMGGAFNPGQNMFFGLAPDRRWGRFAAGQSDPGRLGAGEEFKLNEYLFYYKTRRAAFELEPAMRVKR